MQQTNWTPKKKKHFETTKKLSIAHPRTNIFLMANQPTPPNVPPSEITI